MGQELKEIPKVEFCFIFLLVVMFLMAHFFTTPTKQYNFITTIMPQLFSSSIATIMMIVSFLSFFGWGIVDCISWCCFEGHVILVCIPFMIFKWNYEFSGSIYYSWQWWIVYILGIWNAPYACPLCQIFKDPG